VQVRHYRSIRDTGVFEVENDKTILVGPNEAGKSAILAAVQQLNPPKGIKGFDALRDYPRALYNDITTEKVMPSSMPVVTGIFELDADHEAKKAPPVRAGSCVIANMNLDPAGYPQ
jgi:predicted ATP-binding protein involved in virulence